MKKQKALQGILICFISILLLFRCANSINIENDGAEHQENANILSENITEYQQAVRSFIEVNLDDIELLQQQKKSFYLYIGRESCPYCEAFVILLSRLNPENEIYYIITSLKIRYMNKEHTFLLCNWDAQINTEFCK